MVCALCLCGGAVVDSGGVRGKATLRFVTVGDWGVNGSTHSKASETMVRVAGSMDAYARALDVGFVMALGDNFLEGAGPGGVASASDGLWDASWRTPWLRENGTALSGLPWYAVLGEVDYGHGVEGALAQTRREWETWDDEWRLPAPTYTIKRHLSDLCEIAFVFIDTSALDPLASPTTAPLFNASDVGARLTAVDAALARAAETADWLFVAGHYPVRSVGEHGDDQELVALLEPLLLARGADAYLSAHDATLQRSAARAVLESSTTRHVEGGRTPFRAKGGV